ncbi:hypothetical protein NJBCHELONAE_48700 [Mycobacteroides chelonae]|nr:hypothetical protein NJBCHELONAE_48700 [Mycobacteroides chelonae]
MNLCAVYGHNVILSEPITVRDVVRKGDGELITYESVLQEIQCVACNSVVRTLQLDRYEVPT